MVSNAFIIRIPVLSPRTPNLRSRIIYIVILLFNLSIITFLYYKKMLRYICGGVRLALNVVLNVKSVILNVKQVINRLSLKCLKLNVITMQWYSQYDVIYSWLKMKLHRKYTRNDWYLAEIQSYHDQNRGNNQHYVRFVKRILYDTERKIACYVNTIVKNWLKCTTSDYKIYG